MRDDFPEETKRQLAGRVAHRCSRPGCRAPTAGPGDTDRKTVNIGVAAHITAASPGGPRYDASLTAEQRRHPDNGIWLCQNDAKLIDDDEGRYPTFLLRGWKYDAEQEAREKIGRPEPDVSVTDKIEEFSRLILTNNAPLLVDRMRQDIQKVNPDFRASIAFDEGKTTYAFRLRDGLAEAPAGTLTFPDTDAGREGWRKWREVQDYGHAREFSTGEFTFKPHVRIPGIERITENPSSAHLSVGSVRTGHAEHVRIDGMFQGRRSSYIPFTFLRVSRSGAVESEVELSGGVFPGRWTITWPRDERTTPRSLLEFALPEHPPSVARPLLSLARGIAEGAVIEIVSLATGRPLLGFTSHMAINLETIEVWEEMLDWLIAINTACRCDLRFPAVLDSDTLDTAWLVATGLSGGRPMVVPDGPVTLSGDIPEAVRLAWTRGERPSLVLPQREFELLGRTLNIPGIRVICHQAAPAQDGWEAAVNEGGVAVAVEYVLYDFSRCDLTRVTLSEPNETCR